MILTSEHQVRITYSETDQMGFVYHGNYASFYERGRVEMLRAHGMTYRDMEGAGVAMPVLKLESKFIKPIFYDELVTVKTILLEIKGSRIFFEFEISNEKGDLCNLGKVGLVFVETKTFRPCNPPENFMALLAPYMNKEN